MAKISAAFATVLKASTKAEEVKPSKPSKMPTIDPESSVKNAVDLLFKATVNKKQAEAVINNAFATIEEVARERQDRDGYSGKFSKSYQMLGNDHNVTVTYANTFSIKSADEAPLRRLLGSHYDELIEEKFSVQLRPEVLEDEALQKELLKLLGKKFDKFLVATTTLKVVEGFDEKIYQAVVPESLEALRTFAKQNKASVK